MDKYFLFFKRLAQFFRHHRAEGSDDRPLLEKLRDKYRLVVQNADTFEEVTSIRFSLMTIYVGLSSLVVGTAIAVTLLIIATPLKRYIPGYGDFERNDEIATLTTKVRDLESEIKANQSYYDNLRKILTGDMASFSEEAAKKQGLPANAGDTLPTEVDRIPEDGKLRSEVAARSMAQVAQATVAGGGAQIIVRDVPLEQMSFMPPVSGETTSGFDPSKNHFGMDVAAPKNTAVKSAADGVVISDGYTVETGYSIAVQHPNNVVTFYKHNSVLLKKTGSPVKAGEALAIIGNTGEQTTGPHLHFELWHKGRPVNPADYINFQ